MRTTSFLMGIISIGCSIATTYRPYAVATPVSCSQSSESLRLRLVKVVGDLRPGGTVDIEGEISNCGDSTISLTLSPGLSASTLCRRPYVGIGSIGGDISRCSHGPCPAEVLILLPGERSVVATSQQLPTDCRSAVDVELEYVSEKDDRHVYPSNVWVGTLRAESGTLVKN